MEKSPANVGPEPLEKSPATAPLEKSPANVGPEPSDRIVSLAWKRCESAKRDLDRNWTYQMLVVAAGWALVFGFGTVITKYLLRGEDAKAVGLMRVGVPI